MCATAFSADWDVSLLYNRNEFEQDSTVFWRQGLGIAVLVIGVTEARAAPPITRRVTRSGAMVVTVGQLNYRIRYIPGAQPRAWRFILKGEKVDKEEVRATLESDHSLLIHDGPFPLVFPMANETLQSFNSKALKLPRSVFVEAFPTPLNDPSNKQKNTGQSNRAQLNNRSTDEDAWSAEKLPIEGLDETLGPVDVSGLLTYYPKEDGDRGKIKFLRGLPEVTESEREKKKHVTELVEAARRERLFYLPSLTPRPALRFDYYVEGNQVVVTFRLAENHLLRLRSQDVPIPPS